MSADRDGAEAPTLRYHPQVRRDLRRITARDRAETKRAIETRLLSDPLRYTAPLTGGLEGLRKLRVGDHRIVVLLSDSDVLIVAVAHRRDVHERARRRR